MHSSNPDLIESGLLGEAAAMCRATESRGLERCSIWAHGGEGYDWDSGLERSEGALTIGGRSALHFDAVVPAGDLTSYQSWFVIDGPGSVLTVHCESTESVVDPWVSIAETIEFLRGEEWPSSSHSERVEPP
jgi:hypothetical protein